MLIVTRGQEYRLEISISQQQRLSGENKAADRPLDPQGWLHRQSAGGKVIESEHERA